MYSPTNWMHIQTNTITDCICIHLTEWKNTQKKTLTRELLDRRRESTRDGEKKKRNWDEIEFFPLFIMFSFLIRPDIPNSSPRDRGTRSLPIGTRQLSITINHTTAGADSSRFYCVVSRQINSYVLSAAVIKWAQISVIASSSRIYYLHTIIIYLLYFYLEMYMYLSFMGGYKLR